jgi:DNA end-binding protein Ku
VEIVEAVDGEEIKKPELALAQQVIESLAADFDPASLTSEYRRDLKAMLEAKLAGAEVSRPEPVAEETPVIDLMEALRKSVAEAKERGNGSEKAKAAPKSGSRARRAPARKSA